MESLIPDLTFISPEVLFRLFLIFLLGIIGGFFASHYAIQTTKELEKGCRDSKPPRAPIPPRPPGSWGTDSEEQSVDPLEMLFLQAQIVLDEEATK